MSTIVPVSPSQELPLPCWEMVIRILNYIKDWLILAHSWDLLWNAGTWCSGTSSSWECNSTGKTAKSRDGHNYMWEKSL